MIFRRCGWLTCVIILFVCHCWQILTSVMIHDCIRLLMGNYRMRLQGVDIEQLLAHYSMVADDCELNDSHDSAVDEKPARS